MLISDLKKLFGKNVPKKVKPPKKKTFFLGTYFQCCGAKTI
jgi:hypothetical protein